MATSNGHHHGEAETAESGQQMEAVIAKLLYERLQKDDWLVPGDREAVAYRIAEIMVLSKQLYTQTLPRLLGKDPEGALGFAEELAGFRMALLHFRDLVGDFDGTYLDAMTHEREIDPEGEGWINPEEWTADDLEGEEEEPYR